MADFGFNGFNGLNNNLNNQPSFMDQLKQYFPQQPADNPQKIDAQRNNNVKTKLEIDSESELEYIEPDTSGSLQMVYCRPEKRVYVGRYNFSRKKTDWEAFLSEGEVNLSKSDNSNADMSQIAEALIAVVNELKTMRGEIQEIKSIAPEIETSVKPEVKKPAPGRTAGGQFKKRGEK